MILRRLFHPSRPAPDPDDRTWSARRGIAHSPDCVCARLIDADGAGLFEPGTTESIEVLHDDWCPKLAGGPCVDPPIRARRIA